jgi:hypothetical protein
VCNWELEIDQKDNVLSSFQHARDRTDSKGWEGMDEWCERGTGHAGAASRGTKNATAENTSREIKTEPFGMDWDEIG